MREKEIGKESAEIITSSFWRVKNSVSPIVDMTKLSVFVNPSLMSKPSAINTIAQEFNYDVIFSEGLIMQLLFSIFSNSIPLLTILLFAVVISFSILRATDMTLDGS